MQETRRVLARFKEHQNRILMLDPTHKVGLNRLEMLITNEFPKKEVSKNGLPEVEVVLITVLPTNIVKHFVDKGELGPYRGQFLTPLYPRLSPEEPDPYLIVGASFHPYQSASQREQRRTLNFKEIFSFVFHHPPLTHNNCLIFEEEGKLYFLHSNGEGILEIGEEAKACGDKKKLIFTTGEEIRL